MKLNVGCANIKMEGYTNIDSRQTKATDLVLDALLLVKRYPKNSIDEIFCAHMLEHLDKADGIQWLKDCHTLLKEGGLLYLELPLVDFLFNNCWEKSPEEQCINILYGLQRYPEDYHRYGYTKATIEKLLKDCNFSVVLMGMGRTGKPNSKNGVKIWSKKKYED